MAVFCVTSLMVTKQLRNSKCPQIRNVAPAQYADSHRANSRSLLLLLARRQHQQAGLPGVRTEDNCMD